jgi:DNA-binding protein Fis
MAESREDFRWRSFFQRSTDPLFVLNRQCYLLFVNAAWEKLTGIGTAAARRLYCHRPQPARPNQSWKAILAHVLTPPPEVLEGMPGRHRRLVPGREGRPPCWWDVDFLPLLDEQGFRGLLGRIVPVSLRVESGGSAPPLPETVVTLRQGHLDRLGGVFLASRLPIVRRLAEQVRLASRVQVPVLLVGAVGTGKKTLARLSHCRGPDREGAFAALDCARLPASAIGALLLGESGASARAPLEAVYLGEPSRLPLELQIRLCERLVVPADAENAPRTPRLFAGFTTDPAEEVKQGRLLEEFHHALATFRIDLPSLLQRRDDLPHLVDRFLERLAGDGGRLVHGLTADAWEVVLAYGWPGNLRELYTVLQSARQHSKGETIDATDLPAYVRQAVRLAATPGPHPERALPYDRLIEQLERRLIEMSLRRAKGNKSRAAELLSLSRPRLLRRMQELGITVPE